MIRLSQKAWNNVLIFAMLFMVYLFLASNKILNKEQPETPEFRPLLQEHDIILSLNFGPTSMEKIGRSWRVTSENDAEIDTLLPLIENWHGLQVIDTQYQALASPYVVTLKIAGEEKSRVYQLQPVEDGLQLNYLSSSMMISDAKLADLIPADLL